MPRFSDFTFLSCDGQTPIHVRRCDPEGAVRGVVQIAHGIAEYAARYDAFAAFLAEHGFLVVANDHLGHGQSLRSPEALGIFAARGGWELAVDDMHRPHDLFGGWTMIAAPDNSPEAILHALRTGSYYATQGPQFTRLELKDRVFTAEFSEAVSAVLIGEGYTGWAGVLPDFPMQGMRESATSVRVAIQPEYSGYVRCRIIDAAGRRAWSAPVKVE